MNLCVFIISTHSLTWHPWRSLLTCLSWVALWEKNMLRVRNRTEKKQNGKTYLIKSLGSYTEAFGAWYSHGSCGPSVSDGPCRTWTTIFTWGTLNKNQTKLWLNLKPKVFSEVSSYSMVSIICDWALWPTSGPDFPSAPWTPGVPVRPFRKTAKTKMNDNWEESNKYNKCSVWINW